MSYRRCLLLPLLFLSYLAAAQRRYELNTGWLASPRARVSADGPALSRPGYALANWQPAVVPGTVLTTQLANKQIPDPFYGLNNQRIPDIYATGREYYTYWFAKDFTEAPARAPQQVWLHLRGVNYGCEVYLNGHHLNPQTHYGMFLRQTYNITPWLAPDGRNRLAVLVLPPNPVGNPNGGQGGDGTIALNVASQYTAGWDWIQPVRDRNTGIWDQVTIERTGPVNLKNPHLVTRVPGRRLPTGPQTPARLEVTTELENATARPVSGVVQYTVAGQTLRQPVRLPARSTQLVRLPTATLPNPRLWWPNGSGAQPLYPVRLQLLVGATVSDEEVVQVGVREIATTWNAKTQSRQVLVNGQPLFIKGGNWILSDALLRLSAVRYDAEVRLHRDANLNLLRVWGGALLERPEFYAACDRYGLLVMQDFWMSGDANGRWQDPQKKDDQWTRRQYPRSHRLFVASAADQIKLVRNHASLAMWCGGNEITPPADILAALPDTLLPRLDGTRWLAPYSNSDSLSLNTFGGNGDGPYGIQPIRRFWAERTFPFNSEVGSVGTGDYESLARFIRPAHLGPPRYVGPAARPPEQVDSVWQYHTYISYENYLLPYGAPQDARDFGRKAQLVNYDQYRALIEGFTAHMGDWYTGTIIWKTQNPWTSLRGQLYDCYLDPNAGLYGLRSGAEPLHVMYNPVDSMVVLVNHGFTTRRDLMLTVVAYDPGTGRQTSLGQVFVEINPALAKNYLPIAGAIRRLARARGTFLSLQLLDLNKQPVSRNFYWLPDAQGTYSGLQAMPPSPLAVQMQPLAPGRVSVTLRNPAGGPVAFFNRLAVIDARTQERLLPVFYSDNYLSVLPGEARTVQLDFTPHTDGRPLAVSVEGWNVGRQLLPLAAAPK